MPYAATAPSYIQAANQPSPAAYQPPPAAPAPAPAANPAFFEPPPGPITDSCRERLAPSIRERDRFAGGPAQYNQLAKTFDDQARATWDSCQRDYLSRAQYTAPQPAAIPAVVVASKPVAEPVSAPAPEAASKPPEDEAEAPAAFNPDPQPEPKPEPEPAPRHLTAAEKKAIAERKARAEEQRAKAKAERAEKQRKIDEEVQKIDDAICGPAPERSG
jgi:hypothetical protein